MLNILQFLNAIHILDATLFLVDDGGDSQISPPRGGKHVILIGEFDKDCFFVGLSPFICLHWSLP